MGRGRRRRPHPVDADRQMKGKIRAAPLGGREREGWRHGKEGQEQGGAMGRKGRRGARWRHGGESVQNKDQRVSARVSPRPSSTCRWDSPRHQRDRSGTYIQDLFHYWFEQKRRATAAEKQEQKRRRWKHKNEAIDPLDIDMPCHTQPTFVTEFLD